jgi:hypothetical protein
MEYLPDFQATVVITNFMTQLYGTWDELNVAWIELHYWQVPPTSRNYRPKEA